MLTACKLKHLTAALKITDKITLIFYAYTRVRVGSSLGFTSHLRAKLDSNAFIHMAPECEKLQNIYAVREGHIYFEQYTKLRCLVQCSILI